MTLEDAGEDQIAHRHRRIEHFRRAAAGVAQRPFAGTADLALPSRGRVQAQWQVERGGGSPERFVFGLVVAPVLERILGDHRAGEAQAGGALQLLDPVLDVVQVDHRDTLKAGGIGAAELGEPVVVGAKYGGHQRRVRHLEVKQPLRGIDDFAGHPIERHVLEVLLGVVAAAVHVFEAPLGGNAFGGLEPRAGVRDEADPGEDLVRLDHDLIAHRRSAVSAARDRGTPHRCGSATDRAVRTRESQTREPGAAWASPLLTRSRAAALATGPSPSMCGRSSDRGRTVWH